MQLRDLQAYCSARRFQVVGEYVDAGIFGAKESRPALNRLMEDARKHKFDSIVVWRFDRFARSTSHLLRALEEFRSLGIQFISFKKTSTSTYQVLLAHALEAKAKAFSREALDRR